MQNDINNQNILPVGTTLKNGQYRIVRHLKSGGFGNTYVVEDTSFHERSAMKEFFIHAKGVNTRSGKSVTVSNPVNEDDFLLYKRKFIHEIQRLRELHNRHVVRIYDDFEENNTAYYVMEFIDGESLTDRLSRTGRAMTEAEVTDVLRQVLNALTEVHGKGFVHADITPNNIMIDKSGNVVLIDFGSTKEVEEGNHRSTLAAMTRTPGYTPQEQLDGDVSRMGPWSDFYALGVTLFRLLTLESPLELKDKEEEAFAPYQDHISQPMRDLILWMTKPNRRKRPQTVGEILQYLKEGGGTKAFDSDDDDTTFHRGKSSAGKGQTPPPTRKQEFNPLYVLIGVVVVLGIVLAVWLSSKNRDNSPLLAVDTAQVELPADSVAPSSTEQQEKEVQEEAYTLDATEFFSNTIWKPAKTLPVYGSQECVSKTDQIGTNVKFEVLSAKYYFYSFIEAKVTKNFPSGFSESECKDNLPVGSTIKLLFCEGECIWNVLLDGQQNFALFAFELDKRLLTESPYDGCHKIGGTITKPTEHKKLMMKIKYKGKVGWIKMENNGAYEDPPILLDY